MFCIDFCISDFLQWHVFNWLRINSYIVLNAFVIPSYLRPKARSSSSIILRGANDFMLDEMERSIHDAICVVKRVLESKTVVPGGGAVEAALSIYLENFATSLVRDVELLQSLTIYSFLSS